MIHEKQSLQLKARGIYRSAIEMGWQSESYYSNLGWSFPIFHINGTKQLRDDGTDTIRWKNADSSHRFKNGYIPNMPVDTLQLYFHPELAQAIADAQGNVYLVEGEPDLLTLHTVGIRNAICLFGGGNLPDNFVELSDKLGVTHITHLPDLDKAGKDSAEKVKKTLVDSAIFYQAIQIPDLGKEKADVNDWWIACDFDRELFRAQLQDRVQNYVLTVHINHSADTNALKETKEVRRHIHSTYDGTLPTAFVDAIELALGINSINRKGYGQTCCPFHDDNNPSADWHREKGFLHCHVCGQTWNAKDTGAKLSIRLSDYYEEHSKPIKGKRPETPTRQQAATPKDSYSSVKADVSVHERYITDAQLSFGKTVLIKSPMGTGKTTLMRQHLKRIKQTTLASDNRYPRILAATHRVALAETLSHTLGCENYKGLDSIDLRRIDNLVITVNSIHKLAHDDEALPKYDLIVIDEIEQVLSHLMGNDTFKGNQGPIAYRIMKLLIQNARQVIGLDAHIRSTSYAYLQQLRGDVQVVENTYQPDHGKMYLADNEDALMSAYIKHAKVAKKPIIYLSDHKADVENMYITLKKKHGINNIEVIHSDNSSSSHTQGIIRNINDRLPQLHSLLFSPTIGTGVDIQTDVEAVYANFHGGILNAFQMHQMLGRCRKAEKTYVYLNKIELKALPIHSKEIYNQHYQAMKDTGQVSDIDLDGRICINQMQEQYLGFQSVMGAARNREMLNYYNQFKSIAREEYTIISYQTNERGVLDEIKALRKQISERIKALALTVEPISYEEYRQHKEDGTLTDEIKAGFIRSRVEDTYSTFITPELLIQP